MELIDVERIEPQGVLFVSFLKNMVVNIKDQRLLKINYTGMN